jgi:membrane-bound lytic murein transglycosylase MltF
VWAKPFRTIATMATSRDDLVQDLAATGVLRASINLGNPVLAQGSPSDPSGVSVDIAREVAARLDVPLELLCFDAARKSFEAMTHGSADLCFLAVDPARASEVAFTAPYVETHPELRVIEERFMQIQQAVGTTIRRRPETIRFLRDLVEELKASGFISHSLLASNQPDATVAQAG